MSTSVTGIPAYALGHSEHELERLCRQGEAFEPFTRQLLGQAGIRSGMRVLDVGSGAGDSSFLLAEFVGQGGKVIGIDREPIAVEWATARARSRRVENVQFLTGDPAVMEFTQKFDAVVGRLILMYYRDPIDAVTRLAQHVRPGGLIIFQEFDLQNARSWPSAPTFDRAVGWIRQTLHSTGARTQQGLELHQVFLAAGLPAPSLRMDALIGGVSHFPFEIVAATVESMFPLLKQLNVATARDADCATLAQHMREEVFQTNGIVLSPGLIGAWSRKSV
jgi:SAM-dependent methyltransferase